jgi:uncharacterized protein (TIGR04255 family)
MSEFQPLHEAHAIEQVVFAVQFNVGLDDTAFTKIIAITEPYKELLPRVIDLGAFSFPLLFQSGIPMPPMLQGLQPNQQQATAGRSFSKYRDDGSLETELRIERAAISYRTTVYTTWRQLWSAASPYFDAVVPTYADSAQFASISLSYVDKFHWDGNPEDARAAKLLRPGSQYVTPNVYALEDLWHCHTGAFLHPDPETKRLMNINVDCNDENRAGVVRRVLAIATVFTDMFNQPGYPSKAVAGADANAFFIERLNQLHDHSKQAFGQIINDGMCRRIALVAPSP